MSSLAQEESRSISENVRWGQRKKAADGKYTLPYQNSHITCRSDNAEGKQFFLVDHSEYSHALDGMKDARVVGIIDHHGIGDIRNTERIPVISLPIGATASILYKMYLDCNVGITRDMARAMLISIFSDTKGMTNNVTGLDREAFNYMLPVAEIGDVDAFYAGMKEGKASYGDMSPSQIYHVDYKEYLAGEYTFGIGDPGRPACGRFFRFWVNMRMQPLSVSPHPRKSGLSPSAPRPVPNTVRQEMARVHQYGLT